MLDIGWSELLVIGLLALVVVGPKELPGLLRTIGQYVGKARSIAREFQRSLEDAAREADVTSFKELKDAKRDFDRMTRVDFSEQAKRSASSIGGNGAKKPVTTDTPAPASGAGSTPPAAVETPAASEPSAPAAAAPETEPRPATGTDKA